MCLDVRIDRVNIRSSLWIGVKDKGGCIDGTGRRAGFTVIQRICPTYEITTGKFLPSHRYGITDLVTWVIIVYIGDEFSSVHNSVSQ